MVRDRDIGAVTMSSQYVVKNVVKRFSSPLKTVIEYGPGNGVMTRALLDALAPDGRLLVVESNAEFVKNLQLIGDARLTIFHGKVEDLGKASIKDFQAADAVISSIPFSFIKLLDRVSIVSDTHKILGPKGRFIVFHQYSWFMAKLLRRKFSSVSVSLEPRNIPPCFILEARK